MRFDILTIFPELFAPHLTHGVTRRAFESRQVDVRFWPLRDFADDNYRRVDDRPYGGGPGMVMLVEPLEKALAAAKADRGEDAPAAAIRCLAAVHERRQIAERRARVKRASRGAADDATTPCISRRSGRS